MKRQIQLESVLKRTDELVKQKGGEVRSRQIQALAQALVEAINDSRTAHDKTAEELVREGRDEWGER